MAAQDKESAVEWAVKKMMELAEEGDSAGVERINTWGYERARGSNSRKDTLRKGYAAARARLNQKRESIPLPNDGYADGGEPYTDEELSA